ncbi:MAG: SAM-dependent methyltransferase [Lachnospiraceae bacterium]|jgi:tRNA (adenine22-N1)-methyltransferase|nr:SAM-dependent methyltransferase [Lachnospiraceae bacterium]
MVQLSDRLQAVASLAGACDTLADVGTDHGYIPVYLVGCKRAERAIAMDVNPGPLKRAQEHISRFGLEGVIEARLSDGLLALRPGEADKIVIAGMGGGLMRRILEEGGAAARAAQGLILQPQSEIGGFRAFLWENGYRIAAEDMVYEDGKYYSVIAAKYEGEPNSLARAGNGREGTGQEFCHGGRIGNKYGPMLLQAGHPVLQQYLLWQQGQKRGILEKLRANAKGDVAGRAAELEGELGDIEKALRECRQNRKESQGCFARKS